MNSTDAYSRWGQARLLVLGDLMLDRYTHGDVNRVSPEAPVLVLDAHRQEVRLGGAASVAFLARGLQARVALAGVVGNDPQAKLLRAACDESGIDHQAVFSDGSRPTTIKERFVGRTSGRHPHQILRVDHESRAPIDDHLERRLGEAIVSRLGQYDALLVSDYAKGVCSPRLLRKVIQAAGKLGRPVIVDPARLSDYSRYEGATMVTPNRVEAELASGRKIPTPDAAVIAGERLCRRHGIQTALITLDRQGMAMARNGTEGEHVPTKARQVRDVTGAGDMVLAMIGVCQAVGVGLLESVRLANIAAGLEVQRMGVAAVSPAEIQAKLAQTQSAGADKFVELAQMAKLAESYRRDGKTIVLTNGCFDLLHIGHATYLEEAAGFGDVLVVAVNSDTSTRRAKGPNRPIVDQHARCALLAALACVDHVLVFDDDTPRQLLHDIRPDLLVKGGDYITTQVVGREVVESYGGAVRVTGRTKGVSTSRLVDGIHHKASISQSDQVANS